MPSDDFYPALRAYRSCGFHNRTLAELRRDPSLLRRAVLGEDHHVAHVPNIFGNFKHNNITYHTVLTLIGIEDPLEKGTLDKRSRGISLVRLREFPDDPMRKIWEFNILIPKEYCHEDGCVSQEDDGIKYDQFCARLTNRTFIFAMEFLCCYRFFMDLVLETYRLGNSEVREPLRDTDDLLHPNAREVNAVICRFETVSANLEWLKKKQDLAEWDFSSIQQFLGLNIGRNRTSFLPYYLKWLHEHRVAPEVVEERTMEYIAMAFLSDKYEN